MGLPSTISSIFVCLVSCFFFPKIKMFYNRRTHKSRYRIRQSTSSKEKSKQLLKDPNIFTVTATFLGFTPNPWAEISKLRVNILETNLPSLPTRTTPHYHGNRKLRAACTSPLRKGSLPRLQDSFLSRLNLSEAGASILQSWPARWQRCRGCVTAPYWSFWKDQKSSSNKAYAKYSILNLFYWKMLTEVI